MNECISSDFSLRFSLLGALYIYSKCRKGENIVEPALNPNFCESHESGFAYSTPCPILYFVQSYALSHLILCPILCLVPSYTLSNLMPCPILYFVQSYALSHLILCPILALVPSYTLSNLMP